jgi:hypothetical protein
MPEKASCELVLIVDAAGDYAAGKDLAAAVEAYENEIQPIGDSGGYRVVNLAVAVALPVAVDLAGEAPEQSGAATLAVVS